jgi:hypothetical protein
LGHATYTNVQDGALGAPADIRFFLVMSALPLKADIRFTIHERRKPIGQHGGTSAPVLPLIVRRERIENRQRIWNLIS